ncbi:MAG TPA: trehalose-phosphatase, partial [Caulobacteraceae bacterium]|nr:trehalose-phosphatase [Caulobacteraceae bacterium]
GGRTAVISGRTIEDVDRILDRQITPVAGVHGLQRRTAAGEVIAAEPHPRLDDARAAFNALALAARGLLVEDKGLSVALHYRQAPSCAEPVRDLARRLQEGAGLVLQEGDMVAELRTPGPNKGDALADFMAEPQFAGALPIYIGDDLTDEDAFAAAAAAGGHGILVGERRETCATWRLDDVDGVLAWLAEGLRR